MKSATPELILGMTEKKTVTNYLSAHSGFPLIRKDIGCLRIFANERHSFMFRFSW